MGPRFCDYHAWWISLFCTEGKWREKPETQRRIRDTQPVNKGARKTKAQGVPVWRVGEGWCLPGTRSKGCSGPHWVPEACPSPKPPLPTCSPGAGLQPCWLVGSASEAYGGHRVTHCHCPQKAILDFCSLGTSCPCPDRSVGGLDKKPLSGPLR